MSPRTGRSSDPRAFDPSPKRRPPRLEAWALLALVSAAIAVVTLAPGPTLAWSSERPGGGSSFSGGSRSSGGSSRSSSSSSSRSGSSGTFGSSSRSSGSSGGDYGSGSGGLGLIGWLFSSTLGASGFLFFLLVLAIAAFNAQRQGRLEWNVGNGETQDRKRQIKTSLLGIRASDPNFSLVLLDDFLYALYAHAHTLRANGQIERLSAFVRPGARQTLADLGQVWGVQGIVIGAMRYVAVSGVFDASPVVKITLEFEANYTEVLAAGGTPASGAGGTPAGAETSFYAAERWVLVRNRLVLSRTPDRARVFTCPSCGAPLESVVGGRCSFCQASVDSGEFDWVVDEIEVLSRETRGPILTGTTEEQGTDLPTVVDEDAQAQWGALTQHDPAFSWPALESRIGIVFHAMQAAWSNRDWTRVRPFVSDNLFQMLSYWIDAYRKAQLRNVTENAIIERMEMARVGLDRFYQSITIRVFASSLDYTVADGDGRVVGGSRSRVRRYSEYWTLIRSAETRGAARSTADCPACGAPLDVEMAGHCKYCRAKVTSGQFDWVLSRIEQDDVYDG